MGSPVIMERGLSSALYNCGFVSSETLKDNPSKPFCYAFDMLMLGVGIGFDTLGAGKVKVRKPDDAFLIYQVEDSREGWVESLRKLIMSYFGEDRYSFDFSLVRAAGLPIKTFGGVSCLTGDTILYKDRKKSNRENQITIKELFDIQEREKSGKYMGRFDKIRLRSLDEQNEIFYRNKVIKVFDNGNSPIYEVVTEKGYHIKSTLNHRFYTKDRQWKMLEDFVLGDFIGVNGEKKVGSCKDCGKPISRRAIRCKGCSDLFSLSDTALDTTKRQRKNCRDASRDYCEFCGKTNTRFEVHHLDRNIGNNDSSNLVNLCSSCHRNLHAIEDSYGDPQKHTYLSFDKIISITYVGDDTVYDVQMEYPDHNFVANGFVSHNSGPEPLRILLETVEKILVNRVGDYLTQRDIVDIFNLIGKAVVSGNVRRSAELALGEPTDEFLNLKNYKVNPDREGFGWSSNNSIRATLGMDYSTISKLIEVNGEPGLVWLENARAYSRMKSTEKDNKDDRIKGFNPCVTGDTRIMTLDGPKTFKELADKGDDIIVYSWDKDTKLPVLKVMRNPRITGKDSSLVEVKFDSGLSVRCTYNHSFYSFRGEKVLATNLSIGQSIRAFSMSEHKQGHLRVRGWVNGKTEHQWVARMVWELYNGTIPDGMEVHHKDENKNNNCIDNLQLLTNKEHNSLHYQSRFENGFHHKNELVSIPFNHKVISVRSLEEKEDVYNGTVDDTHSYIILDDNPICGVYSGIVSANCGEINLEDFELCNVVETFPTKHNSVEDYLTTLKYAYLYAKTVTLLDSHWSETNRVMLRNRRIGISMTGVVEFIADRGISELELWCEEGYDTISRYDEVYSDWFAVPKSRKKTTVKPSGTVSLLAGVAPGVHFPESLTYIRRIRLSNNSPYIPILKDAGYYIEPAVGQEDSTSVVEFPVKVQSNTRRLADVTMWEQFSIAAFMQEHWSDNGVSVTVTFDPEKESKDIARALDLFQFKLKAVSLLPRIEYGSYPQMPYEEITEDEYKLAVSKLSPVDYSSIFRVDSIGEKYCTNDSCAI